MNQTASQIQPTDRFHANFELAGDVHVSVAAPTLSALSLIVGKLRPTEAVVGQAVAQTDKVATGKSKPAETAASKPTAEAAKADAPAEKAKSSEQPAGDTEVLDYTVLQKAVFALAAEDKDATLEIRDTFGVTNFKDLPEGKRREALKVVTDRLAAVQKAKAAAKTAEEVA